MHLCATNGFVAHIFDFVSDKHHLLLIREQLKNPSP